MDKIPPISRLGKALSVLDHHQLPSTHVKPRGGKSDVYATDSRNKNTDLLSRLFTE